jgi:hypothetical protein
LIRSTAVLQSVKSRPRPHDQGSVWGRQKDSAGGDDPNGRRSLDGFGDLPDQEREMLFETFRVWQDNDASMRGAAEVLICHPNTVRHRLRRIEKHTGRSLSQPKDVAELCLAFEVHRRLM